MVERVEQVGPVRLRAMQALAERVSPTTGHRHIGDLAWSWTLHHDRPEDCPTALWYAGDTVVAWARLELPATLMAQVDPARSDLGDEVLAWAEDRAGAELAVEACRTEAALIDALHARGYRRREGAYMACLSRGWPIPRRRGPCRTGSPRYRRQGLASAACLAALKAFAAAGAGRAVVSCRGDGAYPVPKLVYESLGFATYARTDWYVRRCDG